MTDPGFPEDRTEGNANIFGQNVRDTPLNLKEIAFAKWSRRDFLRNPPIDSGTTIMHFAIQFNKQSFKRVVANGLSIHGF